MFAEGAPDGDRMLVWFALATSDALVRVVPVPQADMVWLEQGPFMLVSEPDYFFGLDGAVYGLTDKRSMRLMPAVKLPQLRAKAVAALSPSCRPPTVGEYRSSMCWPTTP